MNRKAEFSLIEFLLLGLGFVALGIILGAVIAERSRPNALRISRAALDEIHFSPKCMGQQKDLAANRQYVYANCPGGPITVQNYIFK